MQTLTFVSFLMSSRKSGLHAVICDPNKVRARSEVVERSVLKPFALIFQFLREFKKLLSIYKR